MSKGILYRHNKLCLFALAAVACLIVFLSARGTFVIVADYFRLQNQLTDLQSNGLQAHSKVDLKSFERIDIDKTTFEIMGKAAAKNGVVIERLEQAVITREKNIMFLTKRIVLYGSYAGILKCLSDVAGDLKNIKIASINFMREDRGKNVVLIAEVFFQTVKPE